MQLQAVKVLLDTDFPGKTEELPPDAPTTQGFGDSQTVDEQDSLHLWAVTSRRLSE